MGGWPSAVSFSAMRHLSALVIAAAPMVEPGPTGSARPSMLHHRVARRRAVVEHHVGDVGQALAGGVLGLAAPAQCSSETTAITGRPSRFCLQRHLDDNLVDAAVGEDDEAVGRCQDEVAQDDLAQPFDMLQEHGLALAVGADDLVVVGQRQFDDGVEAGEAAVAREHLLDEHARVAGAEEVHQAVAGDGVRADVGGACQGVELCVLDALDNGRGGGEIGLSRVLHSRFESIVDWLTDNRLAVYTTFKSQHSLKSWSRSGRPFPQ